MRSERINWQDPGRFRWRTGSRGATGIRGMTERLGERQGQVATDRLCCEHETAPQHGRYPIPRGGSPTGCLGLYPALPRNAGVGM